MRLGIDIGGTKVAIGVFTDDGDLIKHTKISVADAGKGLASVIGEGARALISETPNAHVTCCGVGIPGTVSEDGKRILKAPNIGMGEDFCAELEAALGIPCKFIQDSRAAAWGEYLKGAGKGTKTLVCIAIGTGIGTGIVIDGKIYHGALGTAGELGHIPAVTSRDSGRECGCGKFDCTEKYAGGRGLDITAGQILGGDATARELFRAAENEKAEAKAAVEEAVVMLGRIMVGTVNLLSPDALLISGGLSKEGAFLESIIAYVNEHCYVSGKRPFIGKAALGELSPLYGAAMYAEPRRKPKLAASIMCANYLNMGESLRQLEDAGIDYIHCDIMDNHFVPNLMLPPELCTKIHLGTSLPFDYHIMCERPETVVERLDLREGDFVSIHYESTKHLQRVLALVKSKGARAAVALNPATPLEVLRDVLCDIDMVLIMSVNPGFAAQALVPSALAKVARLKKMLAEEGKSDIMIEIDGNCSFENLPKMYASGAEIFVVGTSSLFAKDTTIKKAAARIVEGFKGI